jgi:hypothetical protein
VPNAERSGDPSYIPGNAASERDPSHSAAVTRVAGANPKELHRSGRNRSVDCVLVSIPFLARGTVPFDQLDLASLRYSERVWVEILGPVYALILIGVIFAVTHGRTVDIGSRVPDKVAARRETVGVLVWPSTPRKPIRLSLST